MAIAPPPDNVAAAPSAWRAWCYLVALSFRRQARAHLMVWLALGLLAFTVFLVGVNTQAGRWSMAHWPHPRFKGPTYAQHLENVGRAGLLPWQGPDAAGPHMALGALHTALFEGSGFFVFSNWVVFSIFATFLLPLWSISFATEGLGREREAHNLLWVLTRPLSRPAIYLAKFVALLPWCLLLNLGGFALICLAGGRPGRLALALYWPAVLWGTLAFASLFHLIGACLRRPAVLALLYAFFLETVMGNLPGHFKRLSISFYTRCLMFDRAHDLGIQPERPLIYLPVSGTTAWLVLAGVTVACLVVGALLFTRNEYLDVS
jgi:ABC-type transport system involved in multi-copper enzyme maturation permease subunit